MGGYSTILFSALDFRRGEDNVFVGALLCYCSRGQIVAGSGLPGKGGGGIDGSGSGSGSLGSAGRFGGSSG
jgi:hypothetical protein